MSHKRVFHFLVLILILFHKVANATNDELCMAIIDFANKAKVNEVYRIRYEADWGRFSKKCIHHQKTEEKELCIAFIDHASAEFMLSNIQRVIDCISKEKIKLLQEDIQVHSSFGEFTVYNIPNVNNEVEINVKYSVGVAEQIPFIEMSTSLIKE